MLEFLISGSFLADFSELQNHFFGRLRDHPFKASAFFLGGGVKNLPNLPMDSSKKLPMVAGVKNREKLADVLNGWSHKHYYSFKRGPNTVVSVKNPYFRN